METHNPYQPPITLETAIGQVDVFSRTPRPLVAAGFVAASVAICITYFEIHLYIQWLPGKDWWFLPLAWLMSMIAGIASRGSVLSPLACFLAVWAVAVVFKLQGGPVNLVGFSFVATAISIPSLILCCFMRRRLTQRRAALPNDAG